MFPPAVTSSAKRTLRKIGVSRRVVALHRTAVTGAAEGGLALFESAPQALDLASRDNDDLTRAVKAARLSKGKNAGLAPLVRRITYWRGHGLAVFLAARGQTQAERLVALLGHQGVACQGAAERFDPRWLDQPVDQVQVVVGPLARGVVLPADGIVLVTEEEIFGARAHRRRERARNVESPRVPSWKTSAASRAGDYVVHVEHGIGRYQGLVHRKSGGSTVDLIAVEYAGGDKLYLPVYRLNQIQKYSGGENARRSSTGSAGRRSRRRKRASRRSSARWPTSSCDSTPSAAPRAATPLAPADDDYRAFEATFPFDETPDQARAIADVTRTSKRRARWIASSAATSASARPKWRSAPPSASPMAASRSRSSARRPCSPSSTSEPSRQRMASYPIEVAAMSRFQTERSKTSVIRGLKDGKVDVVVGTHRLLSKDVHFKRPRPPRGRRRAALRRHAQRAHQAAPRRRSTFSPFRRRPSRALCKWR